MENAGGRVIGLTQVEFRSEIFPPADAVEFNVKKQAVIAAAVGIVATPAGLTVQIPEGFRAVVRTFGYFLSDVLAVSDFRFAMTINGIAVSGWEDLRITGRASAYVEESNDTYIIVPERATISVLLENIDGGAHGKAGAYFGGWMWPVDRNPSRPGVQ